MDTDPLFPAPIPVRKEIAVPRIRPKSSILFVLALVALVAAAIVPLGSAGASGQRSAGRTVRGKVTRGHLHLVRKVNVRHLVTQSAAGQSAAAPLAREAGP